MEDFEEALRNIDIFLRILAKKISEDEDYQQNMKVEPMENLLRKKYIIEEHGLILQQNISFHSRSWKSLL